MAELYRAKSFGDGGFEQELVIKRMLGELVEEPEFVDMFVGEAKLGVTLQHPNICRIFEFGRVGSDHFLSMELVEGQDLQGVMRRLAEQDAQMPPHLAAFIALESLRGLHYAHTKVDNSGHALAVIHRDISPSNLLLSYEGAVKLADFGVAQADQGQDTDSGSLKGKLDYLSPEQAERRPLDPRSDLFSMGTVLYEMLSGRRAFRSRDDADTVRRVREVDLPPLSEVAAHVPLALQRIVEHALQRDPVDRYGSARDMADALVEALQPLDDDALRSELGSWLSALFADEIASQRERVADATAIARGLSDEASDADPVSRELRAGGSRTAAWLAVAALAAVLLVIGALNLPSSDVPEDIALATTGSLEVALTPAGVVRIDGEVAGQGTSIVVADLSAGRHVVQLEAEGAQTHQESVRITRGGLTKLAHTFELIPRLATLELQTRPSGVEVWFEGSEVGVTPLVWEQAPADVPVDLELRKEGYVTLKTKTEPVAAGETSTVQRTLKRERDGSTGTAARGPGFLTVKLVGATWGHVFVDGSKLSKTAPLSGYELTPGPHRVRVVNEALGLSYEGRVTIVSGKTATVRASAD